MTSFGSGTSTSSTTFTSITSDGCSNSTSAISNSINQDLHQESNGKHKRQKTQHPNGEDGENNSRQDNDYTMGINGSIGSSSSSTSSTSSTSSSSTAKTNQRPVRMHKKIQQVIVQIHRASEVGPMHGGFDDIAKAYRNLRKRIRSVKLNYPNDPSKDNFMEWDVFLKCNVSNLVKSDFVLRLAVKIVLGEDI